MHHDSLQFHRGHHVVLANVVPTIPTPVAVGFNRIDKNTNEDIMQDRFDSGMEQVWFCLDCGTATGGYLHE